MSLSKFARVNGRQVVEVVEAEVAPKGFIPCASIVDTDWYYIGGGFQPRKAVETKPAVIIDMPEPEPMDVRAEVAALKARLTALERPTR